MAENQIQSCSATLVDVSKGQTKIVERGVEIIAIKPDSNNLLKPTSLRVRYADMNAQQKAAFDAFKDLVDQLFANA